VNDTFASSPSTPAPSFSELVELSRRFKPLEPMLLLTDSIETLRAFAERLRYRMSREGESAGSELDVIVTRREGRASRAAAASPS
jgi:hypothetical protein